MSGITAVDGWKSVPLVNPRGLYALLMDHYFGWTDHSDRALILIHCVNGNG